MSRQVLFPLFFAVFLFFASFSEAKYAHGIITSSSIFKYVDKFCFDTSGPGVMTMKVDVQNPNLLFVIYDDSPESWPSVYKKSLSCDEYKQKNKLAYPHQIKDKEEFNITFYDYVRPHYFYFAILNCAEQDYSLEFTATWLQAQSNWNRQFSFDEQGLLLMYVLFFILFLGLLGLQIYTIIALVRAKSFHPIMRVVFVAIIAQFLSQFCFLIHYGNYSQNGVGITFFKVMGEIFDMVSMIVFTLLIVLISTGWGITNPTLEYLRARWKILAGILGVLFCCYIILFFWGAFGVDPASTLYVYESVPGIIYLVVRFLTTLCFLYFLFFALKEAADNFKRFFFIVFGIVYFLWFISLPLFVLIGLSFEGWYRQKVVTAIYLTSNSLSYLFLIFLLWPSRASKYFAIDVPDVFSGGVGYERL